MEEALDNLKLSSRGDIRRAANVVQIAIMIELLVQEGLREWASFIRKWNQMAARTHQIIGKKALALKYLFEVAPKDTLT